MDYNDILINEKSQLVLCLELKQRILMRVPCRLLLYSDRITVDFFKRNNKKKPVKFKIYHEEVEKIIYKRESTEMGEGKIIIYANGLKNTFYHHYHEEKNIESTFINFYGDDFVIIK